MQILTFGCNDEGALGRNTADNEDAEFVPGLVELPNKVKQISAGDSHTAVLLEDGTVYAWGTFRVLFHFNQPLHFLTSYYCRIRMVIWV